MNSEQKKLSEERERLKSEYQELFSEVEEILLKHDPMDINFGDNTDEYDPEVGTILPRLKEANSVDDVARIIHEEFCKWFDMDDEEVGDKTHPIYMSIASDVWKAWSKFSHN